MVQLAIIEEMDISSKVQRGKNGSREEATSGWWGKEHLILEHGRAAQRTWHSQSLKLLPVDDGGGGSNGDSDDDDGGGDGSGGDNNSNDVDDEDDDDNSGNDDDGGGGNGGNDDNDDGGGDDNSDDVDELELEEQLASCLIVS